MSKVKEILVKAKDILCTKGWIQGTFEKDGACCALGALGNATGDVAGCYFDEVEAEHVLRRVVPNGRIVAFNDTPGRTKEEVLEAFDQAIALASAEKEAA
jgi:hypothetical protein